EVSKPLQRAGPVVPAAAPPRPLPGGSAAQHPTLVGSAVPPDLHRIGPMLRRIDLTASLSGDAGLGTAGLRAALPRATGSVQAADDAVAPILAAVRERGSAAVLEFGERFDTVRPSSLRV